MVVLLTPHFKGKNHQHQTELRHIQLHHLEAVSTRIRPLSTAIMGSLSSTMDLDMAAQPEVLLALLASDERLHLLRRLQRGWMALLSNRSTLRLVISKRILLHAGML
jgi:hypothetical protein